MYFINPIFLIFIPLVIVPFIIHFLFFKKQKKESFSSLFLIKRAYLKNRNLILFKRYLIFILRFLIVLLLVAAFAKPVIKANKFITRLALGSSAEESVKLLILVDRSYSMRQESSGKTLYNVATGAALKILESLGENDKAAVAFFSSGMETKHINWTDDFSSLENIIKASKPGFKGTDYQIALNKSYEFFLKENGGKKVILIAGDLARHGFKNSSIKLKDIPSYNKDITVLGTYFKSKQKNSFIKNIIFNDRLKPELTAHIISVNKKSNRQKITFKEGSLREERLFDVSENGKSLIKFILPERKKAEASAEHCGSVFLKEDKLSIDDEFYYVFEKPEEPVKTLLLYTNPDQLKAGYSVYFLKKLLNNIPSINFKLSEAQRIDKDELSQYRLIIYVGQKTAGSLNEGLKSFVKSGGKLWLIPSSLSNDEGRTFFSQYNLKLENKKTGVYSIEPDLKKKFFKKNNFAGFELNKIKIKKFLKFSSGKKENILWHFSNKGRETYPALIWKKSGLGTVAVFTSSFDIAWSDMALKPAFADFIFSFLKFFSHSEQGAKKNSMIYIGDRFKTELTFPYNEKIKIVGPQNKIYFEYPQNGNLTFQHSEVPGIYSWVDSLGYPRCFAVNIDRRKGESLLIKSNILGLAHINLQDPIADFNSAVFGAQLWRMLLLICVLLFITEGVLSERL
jgi:von Willebrand factor type A domain/Aerotolerance regulator N-terminal